MPSLAQIRHRLWHGTVDHLDGPLLVLTLAIMGIGLATVYSATYDSQNRLFSQLINMSVALTLMWCVAQVPPQKLMRWVAGQRRNAGGWPNSQENVFCTTAITHYADAYETPVKALTGQLLLPGQKPAAAPVRPAVRARRRPCSSARRIAGAMRRGRRQATARRTGGVRRRGRGRRAMTT